MKIVLIGAGNVATHLGQALAKANHQILQVYSRTKESAQALAEKINGIQRGNELTEGNRCGNKLTESNRRGNEQNESTETFCNYCTTIDAVDPTADLYLVMLKDSILGDILPSLVKRNPQALFVHTAGSVPMSIWEGLTNRYGVLYPMQTFSKAREVDFTQVHFFVEANHTSDIALLKQLAGQISNYVFEATSEQRKYLHLSAVFACNFTNHMYAICNELLTAHGLPFSSMFPLIDETARKVHLLKPKEAQTGPAQRNDVNVMQKQEALLKDDAAINDPAVAEIYRLISQHIVKYQSED